MGILKKKQLTSVFGLLSGLPMGLPKGLPTRPIDEASPVWLVTAVFKLFLRVIHFPSCQIHQSWQLGTESTRLLCMFVFFETSVTSIDIDETKVATFCGIQFSTRRCFHVSHLAEVVRLDRYLHKALEPGR